MPKAKTYKFTTEQGFYGWKIDPDAVAGSFEELRKGPGLTAPNLVQAARPEDHPAHDGFEWEDEKAAHEHRLYQARNMIRAVAIVVDEKPPETVYYNVMSGKNRVYEHKDVVVNNADMLASAMNLLIGELESAKRALMQLEAAADQRADVKAMKVAEKIRKPLEQAIAAARA